MKKFDAERQARAIEQLRGVLPKGTTVFVLVLRHTANRHWIKVLWVDNGAIEDITTKVARVCGNPLVDHERAMSVSYVGEVVSYLGRKLWDDHNAFVEKQI